jgi:hypothetical protein
MIGLELLVGDGEISCEWESDRTLLWSTGCDWALYVLKTSLVMGNDISKVFGNVSKAVGATFWSEKFRLEYD